MPVTAQVLVIPAGRAHSNHAAVARSIGADIVRGHYAEGARLPGDAELTERFGVSRPVLREAVKTLVAKGLLSTKTRIGTVVRERTAWNLFDPDVLAWHLDAGIDKRFLRDLAEIRLAVEPRAAALAAERRRAGDIAALEAAVGRMGAAAGAGEGFAEGGFAEADLAFHLAVANASGNAFMRSIGAVIEVALRASFALSAPAGGPEHDAVVAAHARIAAAIAAGDGEAAAAAMTRVILNGLGRHGAADRPGAAVAETAGRPAGEDA